MSVELNRTVLQQLSAQALAKAGIPVIPELQHQVEQQLADKLFPRFEATAQTDFPAAFSQMMLDQLRGQLQQSLERSFEQASLAAIAELALPAALSAGQPVARPIASKEILEGLSEKPEELVTETDASTVSKVTSESSAPTTPSPYPATIPPGDATAPATSPTTGEAGLTPTRRQKRAAQTRRKQGAPLAPGEFTEQAAEEALGGEEVPQEETVEQYKERAVANAFTTEKRRRTARGQPDLTGQQQAAYHYGLNIVANEGAQIGNKLKEGIHTGQFSSFFICLILALIKDIGEPIALVYFDVGLTGTILGIFIGGILTALLLNEGVRFRRWLIKKFFGKAITFFIIGLIPGVNIVFPEYTVGVLLMGYDNLHYIQSLKQQLMNLQQQMRSLKRMAASGPRGLAKARQQLSPMRALANE